MMEVWRAVPGYEGLYQVSDLGRVQSVARAGTSGRILKPDTCFGYRRYALCKNNVTTRHRAHRLVAEAFIPNPENKPQVNHINGVKTDNRAENLEWCTGSENQTHSRRVLKKHCGRPKKPVLCIETGEVYPSITAAAEACRVPLSALSRVLNGQLNQTHNIHFKFYEKEIKNYE